MSEKEKQENNAQPDASVEAVEGQLVSSKSATPAISNAVHVLSIPFTAKTKEGEQVTDLDIEWGWDLFLGKKGADEYDNRIAIAACALCNAAYSPDEIQALMGRLGFEGLYLGNEGMFNATSAYVLGRRRLGDTNKTLFAVVNRGSQTLTDWKGNIVSETIQQSGYFAESAKKVADSITRYVQQLGVEPEDALFLVTGHSLGGVVTDILAAQELNAYPGKNVYAYTFAAPLADASIKDPKDRPIYNIINQRDIVTSIPPRLSYRRLGDNNYGFVPSAKSSKALAEEFRSLSGMDISALEEMNAGLKGIFKQPIQTIMWNHSLTTYMAYLLAGGPKSIKREGFLLWNLLQNR